MKRSLQLFLIIFYSTYCTGQVEIHESGINQRFVSSDVLSRIAKDYFRSNPYDKVFSKFLNHLMNDPTLTNKQVIRRTDTSLFFFKGEYQNHSPFGYKADRTEIRFAETEIELGDTASTKDTLLAYQVLGYSYGGKAGLESVKKEFTKFNRRYGKNFYGGEISDIKKEEEIIGGIKYYFVLETSLSPITITWAKLDELQNVFIITIRMKVKENIAGLPIPPDSR